MLSIDRMKQDAWKLKKAQGIKYHQALNVVAISHGFQSYTHARRELLSTGEAANG